MLLLPVVLLLGNGRQLPEPHVWGKLAQAFQLAKDFLAFWTNHGN